MESHSKKELTWLTPIFQERKEDTETPIIKRKGRKRKLSVTKFLGIGDAIKDFISKNPKDTYELHEITQAMNDNYSGQIEHKLYRGRMYTKFSDRQIGRSVAYFSLKKENYVRLKDSN